MFCQVIPAVSQTDSVIRSSQFLFPEFSIALLKLKTGEIVKADMNYNTITQKMTFSQNGSLSDLNKPEAVDTIIIQNKKFIPFRNAFLEVLVNDRIPLYIQHKSNLRSGGRTGAYGTKSQTLGTNTISTLYSENKTYDLSLTENFNVVPSPLFWIKTINEMHRIDSEHQFIKLFPKREEQIRQFIKEYTISFKKQEDLIKLVNFCNGL